MRNLHNCIFFSAHYAKSINCVILVSMIKESTPLTRWLKRVALLLFLVTIGTWIYTGAHFGWTMTQVQEIQIEEITEMEMVVFHDRFVAGIDFLAAGVSLSLLLLFAGLFLSHRYRNHLSDTDPLCEPINKKLQ